MDRLPSKLPINWQGARRGEVLPWPERRRRWSWEEKPQHPVTIVKPFAIGRYEVTKAEYAAFIAATYPRETGCSVRIGGKWGFDGKADWHEPGFAVTDRDPVVCERTNGGVVPCARNQELLVFSDASKLCLASSVETRVRRATADGLCRCSRTLLVDQHNVPW